MEPTIYKSNSLIQASYRLSLPEIRIILLSISKINSVEEISEKTFYEVTANEYANFSGIELNNSYKELKKSVDRLFDRTITLTHEANSNAKLTRPIKTRFLSAEILYYEHEAKVGISFSSHIIPYLSQLSKCFTSYKLASISGLKTFYAIRIFELLKQHAFLGTYATNLDDLRNTLQIGSKYKSIKDFKLYVIDPSLKAINTTTSLTVEYSNIKQGRKIIGLEFTINDSNKHLENIYIQQNALPGESYSQAKKRLTKAQLAITES